LWALGWLLACGGLLGIAIALTPDAHGLGTHRQLGFGACGMLVLTGFPCPTCGMTTAFSHTVRGQWLQAFWVQPSGFVLALATIAIALVSAWVLVTGRPLPWRVPYITPFWMLVVLLVLFVGGWAFKLATGLIDGTLPMHMVPA